MEKPPTIRELYPHFTEEELREADQNLDRYLEIVLRIFERREAEQEEKRNIQKFDSPQGSTRFCGKCDF